MIAVSNTTPLRYLIGISREDLLKELFEKVFVPAAVHAELTDARTPEKVRRWFLTPLHSNRCFCSGTVRAEPGTR